MSNKTHRMFCEQAQGYGVDLDDCRLMPARRRKKRTRSHFPFPLAEVLFGVWLANQRRDFMRGGNGRKSLAMTFRIGGGGGGGRVPARSPARAAD